MYFWLLESKECKVCVKIEYAYDILLRDYVLIGLNWV